MLIKEFEDFLRQHIPMIDFSQLTIEYLKDDKCIVKMPFIPQNKNHLQSMYFGAILIGTEVAAGILTLYHIKAGNDNSTLVLKDIAGDFLRRAEGDVYFICEDSQAIANAVDETARTKKRVNATVRVFGVMDLNKPDEKISDFNITVSVKSQ